MKMKLEALLKVMFPDYDGEFYPTGSEVYGYPNESSDYDFMVLELDGYVRHKMITKLEELETEVEHSNYFNCIKFQLFDKKINLIFLNPTNYEAWIKATKAMKALKKFHESQPVLASPILKDKRLRCLIFQEMVLEFGGEDVGQVYEPMHGNVISERTGGLLFPSNTDEDIPF